MEKPMLSRRNIVLWLAGLCAALFLFQRFGFKTDREPAEPDPIEDDEDGEAEVDPLPAGEERDPTPAPPPSNKSTPPPAHLPGKKTTTDSGNDSNSRTQGIRPSISVSPKAETTDLYWSDDPLGCRKSDRDDAEIVRLGRKAYDLMGQYPSTSETSYRYERFRCDDLLFFRLSNGQIEITASPTGGRRHERDSITLTYNQTGVVQAQADLVLDCRFGTEEMDTTEQHVLSYAIAAMERCF